MQASTNRLVRADTDEEMRRLAREGFEPVPPGLQRAAAKKLRGQREVTVARHSGGRLSKWAAKRRREQLAAAKTKQAKAAKRRRRMAKDSRRRNRKG